MARATKNHKPKHGNTKAAKKSPPVPEFDREDYGFEINVLAEGLKHYSLRLIGMNETPNHDTDLWMYPQLVAEKLDTLVLKIYDQLHALERAQGLRK